MYATLKRSGTQPEDSDVLNRCVRYGESRSTQSLSSHVGVGSRLDGTESISLITSSQLRGVNRRRDNCDCESVNVGGDVSSVAVRIDATFDSKKSAKSFAVRVGLAALGLSRQRMASTSWPPLFLRFRKTNDRTQRGTIAPSPSRPPPCTRPDIETLCRRYFDILINHYTLAFIGLFTYLTDDSMQTKVKATGVSKNFKHSSCAVVVCML